MYGVDYTISGPAGEWRLRAHELAGEAESYQSFRAWKQARLALAQVEEGSPSEEELQLAQELTLGQTPCWQQ